MVCIKYVYVNGNKQVTVNEKCVYHFTFRSYRFVLQIVGFLNSNQRY